MRITPEQAQLIKTTIAREIDPGARIWLFGSRVDDQRRGGDIDLYIETEYPDLMRKIRCNIKLEEALDLHVDLITARPGQNHPIHNIARKEGIPL